MAARALIFIILIAFLSFKASESCGISVYWGRNGAEGSLRDTCATGLYTYVNLAFLSTFGSGQTPVLNLDDHCNSTSGACRALTEEIRFCQSLGIQVLLSLGGPYGNYTLSSPQDAVTVANYLLNYFLSGNPDGPLGNATLDGIDFDIEHPGSTLYWDDLARALAGYRTPGRKIYLAAAPQCPYPDENLEAAIKTGVFDYVWVQFYNNPSCEYTRDAVGLIRCWNQWSSSPQLGYQLFMGLPASPVAASGGYILPDNLRTVILPVIMSSGNYGGVMLWNRYYDFLSAYSSQIYSAVYDANLKLPSDGLYSN